MGDINEPMRRWYKHGQALLDEIRDSRPQSGEVFIWFAGQHGFIIKAGGLVLYIDVILNELPNKEGVDRRVYPPPFEPSALQKVDYVLCTHNHGDHLNLKTLAPLAEANPSAIFVVPAPFKHILTGAGIKEQRVLGARAGGNKVAAGKADGDSFAIGEGAFTIIPVPAIHTRYIQDEGEKDENGDYTALGFILKAGGISMYHSGDTWVTPSLIQSLKTHAPLDIAMLPINGTDWERTQERCIGNVGYLDAAKLARVLPIDLTLPSHYDMMANNSENPARFVEAMYSLCPEKRFHVCALGERFIYRKEQ